MENTIYLNLKDGKQPLVLMVCTSRIQTRELNLLYLIIHSLMLDHLFWLPKHLINLISVQGSGMIPVFLKMLRCTHDLIRQLVLRMQVNLPDTSMADHPFSSFTDTFSGLSASFGLTYNVTKELYLKANIGRGFRAPNIAEISANGVHPGTLIYQIGNTSFKPEFSLQEDLGISLQIQSYQWRSGFI